VVGFWVFSCLEIWTFDLSAFEEVTGRVDGVGMDGFPVLGVSALGLSALGWSGFRVPPEALRAGGEEA
jgi:hypothetical protein